VGLPSPTRGQPLPQSGDFASSESRGAQTTRPGRNPNFLSSRRGCPDCLGPSRRLPGVTTLAELIGSSRFDDSQ